MKKARSSKLDYVERAYNYALKVVEDSSIACIYVRQAARRFLDDIERVKNKKDDLTFNYEEAERWCSNLELLPHTKGKWAKRGDRLILAEWQIFCTVNIYGFYWQSTGRRRFREAYVEVPRKNGKSLWFAGLGVGGLTWEGEHGAEIYCGATTEKQAWEIFKPAKIICDKLPELRKKYGVSVNAKTIVINSNGSKFEPLIGDPGDGASPSVGIADEFHEHDTSDQVDTVITGMGARDNPLMLFITTAGANMGGPCYAKRDDVKAILSGTVKDDNVFGIIYTLDEDDQWDTVEAQKKANPNFGISVDPEFLKGQLAQARRSAEKQVAYKTKHLNLWVGAKAAWMNMLAYQACRKKNLDINKFKGQRCFIAVDLASRVDVASKIVLFPPNEISKKFTVFATHYLPEETILDNTRYKQWHAGGYLNSTGGNTIDFDFIEDDLLKDCETFEVDEIGYDPFQATQFSTHMVDLGLPMVEIRPTVLNFSEPMKELEALILNKDIQFDIDPVLMWMFGNVVAKLDKKDNIYPDKEQDKNKIDGVVALIMCMNRVIHHRPFEGSMYDNKVMV